MIVQTREAILTETEVKAMPKLGLCLAGWAKKLAKESGRTITNRSGRRGMPRSMILNGEETKKKADDHYGKVYHPTIQEIVIMITDYCEEEGLSIEHDVLLWSFDLRKAYTLLFFADEEIKFIGVE